MRIAVDARAAAEVPAGRGRYVREIVRQLAALPGERELVLLARRQWPCAELDADPRVRWELVPGSDHLWPLAAARAIGRRADVALAMTTYLLAVAARVPSVAVVHDLAPFDRRFRTPWGSAFERVTLPLAVRRAARLACVSQATRGELVSRFPRAEPKTDVVPNAADARFSPQPQPDDDAVLARHGIDGPYVLAVGTLEPRKNLPRLIEAFAGLPAEARGAHTLVLVGARGWQTAETFAGVARHADAVRALGFVDDDDLPALYRRATMLAYPSLHEGFGIPVLEALQSGTPVLTSNVSSLPEVAGEAADYADPTDTDALRAALAALLGDEARRRELAALGPERARRFSWRSSAERMLALLEAAAR